MAVQLVTAALTITGSNFREFTGTKSFKVSEETRKAGCNRETSSKTEHFLNISVHLKCIYLLKIKNKEFLKVEHLIPSVVQSETAITSAVPSLKFEESITFLALLTVNRII